MTAFWETDHSFTNTENPFLLVHEGYSSALYRGTKNLTIRGWPGLLLKKTFFDAAKPRGYILQSVWPLRGINRTTWGVKLLLTAGLAYSVSCASLCPLLMTQHCCLHPNGCLWIPIRPQLSSHVPPICPPPINSIYDITGIKNYLKTGAF